MLGCRDLALGRLKFKDRACSPGVVPEQVITAQTGRLLQDSPYSVKLLLHDE